VFFMLALLLLGVQSAPANIRTVVKGPTSGIHLAKQVVVRSAEEWQELWRAHGASGQDPAIDFSREMVVGVFGGERPTSGYGVEIVRTLEAIGTLIVDYVETRPAADAITAQIVTSPYHLVAVPKHDGEVRFQKTEN
jgi:hypothetical protein